MIMLITPDVCPQTQATTDKPRPVTLLLCAFQPHTATGSASAATTHRLVRNTLKLVKSTTLNPKPCRDLELAEELRHDADVAAADESPEEAAAALSVIPWATKFAIGRVVSAVVSEVKEYGVLCDMDDHEVSILPRLCEQFGTT